MSASLVLSFWTLREIEHVDPPSVIPPAEAQKIVDVQHAGFIERNLGAAADTSAEYGAEEIKMIGHVTWI